MIKNFLKKAIIAVLNLEMRFILRKYNPEIIAITGSVGKTSAKEAICAILSAKFNVRKSEKSYNNELGVPLTVIGAESARSSPFGWLKIIFLGAGLILKRKKEGATSYPEKLILELGADRPGDISNFVRILKPDVGVVTAVGEVPVHVEFFSGPEEVAKEKSKLVEPLSDSGWAILNGDDYSVLEMKEKTKAQVLTYGFDDAMDIYASEYNLVYLKGSEETYENEEKERIGSVPKGITFKINYNGSSVPIRINGSFGRQNVYAVLAGSAVGVAFNMNMVEISEAVSKYSAPAGRLKLLEGEKETWILDDTYNASPQSMSAAIDLLEDLPVLGRSDGSGGRKIAVIGDMLEIGKFTIQAHQAVGERLKNVADFVITVGPRAKFIARELEAKRFGKKKIINVSDSVEAGRELERIIEPGDIILVKGSQALRMERAVEEIMAHPEEKEKLLARQETEWLNKE